MKNLLENLALVGTQVTRLHADLLKGAQPGGQIQAQVEIKLSPIVAKPESVSPGNHHLSLSFRCVGNQQTEGSDDTALFKVECVLNAAYRQLVGDPISVEEFTRSHTSLGRQLYPLVRQLVTPLLVQLGYPTVQLPMDLFQASKEASESPVGDSASTSLH